MKGFPEEANFFFVYRKQKAVKGLAMYWVENDIPALLIGSQFAELQSEPRIQTPRAYFTETFCNGKINGSILLLLMNNSTVHTWGHNGKSCKTSKEVFCRVLSPLFHKIYVSRQQIRSKGKS